MRPRRGAGADREAMKLTTRDVGAEGVVLVSTKSAGKKRKLRTVPLHERAKAAIAVAKAHAKDMGYTGDRVFVGPTGRPWENSNERGAKFWGP